MSKYDPNTRYNWEKDTKFELSGNEFGLILNTFRTILQSPESQKVLILNEANKAIEGVLSRNVESGVVKPVEDGPQAGHPGMDVVPENEVKKDISEIDFEEVK